MVCQGPCVDDTTVATTGTTLNWDCSSADQVVKIVYTSPPGRRIARQASAMYADAAKRLTPDSAPLARAMGRPTGAHVAAKAALLSGLSWYVAVVTDVALSPSGHGAPQWAVAW